MTNFTRRFFCFLSLLTLMGFPSLPVWGATDASSVAGATTYEGADREQRLLEAAKKEGAMYIYTSIAAQDTAPVIAAFEKKYGLKVKSWRASANDVLQRVITEAAANRFDFDVVTMTTPEMEAIYREKLLQEVRSPHFKDLNPAILPAHKAWAGIYINVFVQAYNTNKVKKEELPKTYLDLLDSKWKGRLGMEDKSQEWFYALLKDMGEEKGLKFFRDLVATNKPTVRSGNNVINSMVVAGEVPFAMSGYLHLAEPAKRQGAPLDWIALEPVIATYNGVGISKKAPHPATAMLFYDFLITDAQVLFIKMVRGTVNRKVESPIKGMKIKLLDPAAGLDEYDKATKLYENVLRGK